MLGELHGKVTLRVKFVGEETLLPCLLIARAKQCRCRPIRQPCQGREGLVAKSQISRFGWKE